MGLPLNQVMHGDCLEVMGKWPSDCIDLTDGDLNLTRNSWYIKCEKPIEKFIEERRGE